jgi:hypothetical protein
MLLYFLLTRSLKVLRSSSFGLIFFGAAGANSYTLQHTRKNLCSQEVLFRVALLEHTP